ncbi:MAG: hypothetical protein KJO34_19225 [Deltaproteobacteria bacterium]|nr:hypothetical protein [Deltaproteobacteria bacterium]
MKIFVIVISFFVFLVVPKYGWAGDCSFLQISFFSPYQLVSAEKDVCGLRLNLPIGENENLYGLDLGLVGVTNNSYNGAMLNIVGNFNAGSSTKGIVAGLINFNIGGLNLTTKGGLGTKGIELGGFLNLNLGDIQGMQIAGLANIGNIDGIQVAGLHNGGIEVRGVQVAGLYNYAESVRGIQIGLINVAKKLSGLQIGLVNYIRESPVPIFPIINLNF